MWWRRGVINAHGRVGWVCEEGVHLDTPGDRGWGWLLLCLFDGVFGLFGGLVVCEMFEVASPNRGLVAGGEVEFFEEVVGHLVGLEGAFGRGCEGFFEGGGGKILLGGEEV